MTPHAHLTGVLPPHDLDRLEAQHAGEEAAEAARHLIDLPRPMHLSRPAGGKLPASEALLARLYAGDRVPKEKKPPVFDHLRSAGPWMVSIDAEPLAVLDGMSQTATIVGGFAEEPVVRAYTEGEFADTLIYNEDSSLGETWAAAEYASTLRQLVPGLPHVTFVASGAEANEKAMVLCRINCARTTASKVLAFEGSFHGRTLLSLHATHSPSKRAPFELDGYQCKFAPFPVWHTPDPDDEPLAPSGFYAAAATADIAELTERFGDPDDDALLAAEVASLAVVHEALASGEYFCTIVEPMQSEGGDRYATERFFRALRLLTRFHQTFLVFDEVQVGFGLGGPFAWHSKFRLLNQRGQPDYPDAVTFAKRAQVGVVMSRFADPEHASAHNASLVRGRLHADMVSTSHNAERLENLVAPRLAQLARAYPHLVQHPRASGYAFAFDLPTPALLDAFLAQRFWRGTIVFGAGTRTARYRLSDSFLAREVDLLFESVRRSLSWLDAHEGQKPPAWEDPPAAPAPVAPAAELHYRLVPHDEAMDHLPAILDIEYQVYEPARRTPPAEIRAAIADAEGSLHVVETAGTPKQLLAFAIGTPLEMSKDVEGPDDDPMLGKHNTMYSVSITVAPTFQSSGIGRKLKELQLRDAMARKKPDGTPRYRYVTGRNRVGRTAQMTHLNRVFGAHVVSILTGQYEDPEGQAIYYRIPLGPIVPDPIVKQDVLRRREKQASDDEITFDLASGLTRPFASGPASWCARGCGLCTARRSQADAHELRQRRPAHARGLGAGPRAAAPYLRLARRDDRQSLRLVRAPQDRPGRIGLEGGLRAHGRVRALAVGPGGPSGRARAVRLAARPASRGRRDRGDDRRAAGRGRRGRWADEDPRVRLRAGAGAHRPRAAARVRHRARRAAYRARPAADRGRDHDVLVSQRARRVPVAGAWPRARRADLVGRRADRLPPHLRALVRRVPADPGLDLGWRRAVAGAPASPAPRSASPRHRGRCGGARRGARQARGPGTRGVSRAPRRRPGSGARRGARRSRDHGARVSGRPPRDHPGARSARPGG